MAPETPAGPADPQEVGKGTVSDRFAKLTCCRKQHARLRSSNAGVGEFAASPMPTITHPLVSTGHDCVDRV